MQVLQVSSALQRGGAETHVLELAEALQRLGHIVAIAGRPGGAVNPDVEFPFRNALDIRTALRLRAFLKNYRFDIVHAHVARDYSVVTAAALGLAVKVVLTRHLLYPIKRHFLYRRVNGWIAPTTGILKTLDPLRPHASAVIPNWVDLEKFPFKPHQTHEPMTLGLLGQISPHKGHDDAIETLRLLGSGYRLLIAGRGENDYVARLRESSMGLPVTFLGVVSIPDFFEAIDVLLVPSWEEPFGIVLLEGMASGIPVIATAAGGPVDIIRSGVDGILVPPRNPQGLADAIHSIRPLRQHLAEEARQRVEDKYDILKVIPRIEEFYRTL